MRERRDAVLIYATALALMDVAEILKSVQDRQVVQLAKRLRKVLEFFYLFKLYPNVAQAFSNDAMLTFLCETKNILNIANNFIGNSKVNICIIPFNSALKAFQTLNHFYLSEASKNNSDALEIARKNLASALVEARSVRQPFCSERLRTDKWIQEAVNEITKNIAKSAYST